MTAVKYRTVQVEYIKPRDSSRTPGAAVEAVAVHALPEIARPLCVNSGHSIRVMVVNVRSRMVVSTAPTSR
jgi:hypothetical protein